MSKRSKERRAKERGAPQEAHVGYTPDPANICNLRGGGIFTPDGTGGGTLRYYNRKTGTYHIVHKEALAGA